MFNPRNPENILDVDDKKIFCPVFQFCVKEIVFFSLLKENIFLSEILNRS